MVLHGGGDAGGGTLTDTWAWDGGAWAPVPVGTLPSATVGFRVADDRWQRALVGYGGAGSGQATWLFAYQSAAAEIRCTGGADDDGDGLVDCDDPDCNFAPECAPTEDCTNGVDDDGDSLVDCDDPNCGGHGACP